MKKLILLAVLIFGMNMSAQEAFISTSFDVRNAIIGSDPTNNKPALDLLLKCGFNTEAGFEIQVQHESFNKIGFSKQAVGFGWKLPITDELSFTPLVEPTLMHRKWKPEDNAGYNSTHHLGLGVSISTRYKLNDKFGIELFTNTLYRGDLDWRYGSGAKPWVTSVYAGITYQISR